MTLTKERLSGLIPLGEVDLPAVHQMMVLQDFPGVPWDVEEALRYLREVDAYGVFHQERLIAAFLLGERTEDSAFLDAVCAPQWEGRWMTRRVVRNLGRLAFEEGGHRFLWMQTAHPAALRAAAQAGFVPTSAQYDAECVFVLTRTAFERKFLSK